MTPSRRPTPFPKGLHRKRREALQKLGITMAEVARRYSELYGLDKPLSVSAVSHVMAGRSISEPLEAFIETEILGVKRYSLFPER